MKYPRVVVPEGIIGEQGGKPQRCGNLKRAALPRQCKSCFGERQPFKERKALKSSL
jgi:hypothetical protein